MELNTRDFGIISIDEQDIIQFEGAIYGFEEYKKYAFLFQESISEHFVWLQSTEEPGLCFILVEPSLIIDNYHPAIPEGIEKLLGPGNYMCWLIVVIKDDFKTSTANLKSPIIVNPATKKAAQIILDHEYPIHYPLLKQKEDGSSC